MKFRKKPVEIEARQWDPGAQSSTRRDIIAWIQGNGGHARYIAPENRIAILTLEGPHSASPGDWIIRGVKGEFYPCKPDIFTMTYEPVEPRKESPRG